MLTPLLSRVPVALKYGDSAEKSGVTLEVTGLGLGALLPRSPPLKPPVLLLELVVVELTEPKRCPSCRSRLKR